jgi:hypothetical protein
MGASEKVERQRDRVSEDTSIPEGCEDAEIIPTDVLPHPRAEGACSGDGPSSYLSHGIGYCGARRSVGATVLT